MVAPYSLFHGQSSTTMQLCFVEIFKQSRKNYPYFCQVPLFFSTFSSPCANAASIVSASHSFNFPGVRDKKKPFEVERMQRMYWCGCFCFECCREVEMQPGKVFYSISSLSLKVYQNKHRTAVENHSGGKLTVVAIVSCSFSTIIR